MSATHGCFSSAGSMSHIRMLLSLEQDARMFGYRGEVIRSLMSPPCPESPYRSLAYIKKDLAAGTSKEWSIENSIP